MKYYAIIASGGKGTRMESHQPKQFLLLHGRPMLMYTLEAFYKSLLMPEIFLVLDAVYHDYWSRLCQQYNLSIPHQLIQGGNTRFHSVKNALAQTQAVSIIAVHDAARPLINTALIDYSYQQAANHGSAVLAVPSSDSIRQIRGNQSFSLPKEEIYLMQTPQTFLGAWLHEAYSQEFNASFTDDATVVEHKGFPIHIIRGEPRNLKITFPEDLLIAELLMQRAVASPPLSM